MAKVKCKFCLFQTDSFCSKKKKAKVKINKRRSCDLYQDDASKFLDEYRRAKKHIANLKRAEIAQKYRSELFKVATDK